MSVLIVRIGGVGIHTKFSIHKDSKKVAYMSRFGPRHGWTIRSVHYNYTLANGGTSIDAAKAAAEKLDYPDEQTVYETICRQVEPRRRAWKEQQHAHDYARLARDLVAGSNTARAEIEELVITIETFALDRSDWKSVWYEDVWSRDQPYYPKPPGIADG